MKKVYQKALVCSGLSLALPVAAQKILFAAAKFRDTYEEGWFYESSQGKIHYQKAGHGRPVLLIHGIGMGCSHLEWARNFEELSKHYLVYAIDLPGFGYSAKPKMTYTAYTYATLINDFIRDVIRRPVAVMASNTSAIFTVLAYTLERGNFRRMLLIEPSGVADQPAKNSDRIKRTLLELPVIGDLVYLIASSRRGINLLLREEVLYTEDEKVSRQVTDQYYYPAHRGGSGARYSFASFVTRYMILDIREHLAKVRIPLYVVWGEYAQENPAENMEIVRQYKPNAAYYVFEETRLLPHYENPTEFNDLVLEVFG